MVPLGSKYRFRSRFEQEKVYGTNQAERANAQRQSFWGIGKLNLSDSAELAESAAFFENGDCDASVGVAFRNSGAM